MVPVTERAVGTVATGAGRWCSGCGRLLEVGRVCGACRRRELDVAAAGHDPALPLGHAFEGPPPGIAILPYVDASRCWASTKIVQGDRQMEGTCGLPRAAHEPPSPAAARRALRLDELRAWAPACFRERRTRKPGQWLSKDEKAALKAFLEIRTVALYTNREVADAIGVNEATVRRLR